MMVFLLSHARQDDQYRDHEKIIGVYSSEAGAESARQRLANKPGFRDWPEGFEIAAYPLDEERNWADGFISWDESAPPNER